MIPLVSYGNFLGFSFAAISAVKLFFSMEKAENKYIRHFFFFYLYLAVFFLLYSVPKIISENLTFIEYSFQFALVFLYLALAYFIIIPLELRERYRLSRIFFWGILILIPLIVLLNLINTQPTSVFISPSGKYVYWLSQSVSPFVRYLTASIVTFVCFFGGGLFMFKGKRSSERVVKIRSFLIGLGVLVLALASFMNYVLVAINPDSFFNHISGSLFSVVGLGMMLFGIYYKYDKKEKSF